MQISKLKPWNWFRHEKIANENNRKWGKDWLSDDTITPWHGSVPFTSLPKLRHGINHMLQPLRPQANENQFLLPRIDITSTNDAYHITVEVPGVNEKDISLEIAGDMLVIRGEKRQEIKENKKDIERIECTYGFFQRVLSLPPDATRDKADASLKNGILHITMPRHQSEKPLSKQVPIKHAA